MQYLRQQKAFNGPVYYLKSNVSVVTSMDIYQRIAQRSPEDQMAKVPVRDQRV